MKRKPHVFGPVPSRRLGLSLGVDLVPHKTCTLDCIYCQVGATTNLTLTRKEWVSLDEVASDLHERLGEVRPDVVTFSGLGEPTLHSGLGHIITRVRAQYDGPICVITNGTLLHRADVRGDLAGVDIVLPSLDAGDEGTFEKVNRPHQDLDFATYLEGLRTFRAEFAGSYRLEVFLVKGVNDSPASLHRLAEAVAEIDPDIVELNTSRRLPGIEEIAPLSKERMKEILPLFGPRAEIIASFSPPKERPRTKAGRDDVEALLRRRTCTAADVAAGLGIDEHSALSLLEELRAQSLVEVREEGFYRYREI